MTKLNVLVVEDGQGDCILLGNELRAGGFSDVHVECVQTAIELTEALKSSKWHIILSNYNLHGFTGLEALKIMQSQEIFIPFILVSDAIGEELAVAALKEGVDDCIVKDRLFRLAPTVRRELEVSRRKKALLRAQKKLDVEKRNADIANQRKSQVLAFVAHEFKNPINALLLHVDLLHKGIGGKLSDTQREFVQNIHIGTKLLEDLVTDLLDIAAIEAGKINIYRHKVLLEDILSDVQSIISPLAEQKKIQLIVENKSSLHEIIADPKRLKQILINLLSNALKYTPENGKIKLSIDYDSRKNIICFHVKDNGVGLSKDELPQLFNEYYRAYNLLTTKSEGVGLGLAVTKRLVELHDGSISVKSTPGKGTTFTVRLPQNNLHDILAFKQKNTLAVSSKSRAK